MWKPWEIEIIKNVYPSGEVESVLALLPNKTANGRATLLSINKAQWMLYLIFVPEKLALSYTDVKRQI